MSRHRITQLPEHQTKLHIVVGWDPPLRTFFANVIDVEKDEADDDAATLLMVGCRYDEIPTVTKLQERIAEYAVIPSDLLPVLEQEKASALGQPRTLAQGQIELLLKGMLPD